MVLGAWMLFAPRDHDRGNFGPDQAPSQPAGVQPTQQESTDSGYDPNDYQGPLNTPTFSPRPHRSPTDSPSAPATTAPTSTTSEPPPPPTSTTSGPGNGHGHGHGHKP